MKQQQKYLKLVKQVKEELHGKLEHSVEVKLNNLIAEMELALKERESKRRSAKIRYCFFLAMNLLVRFLPEIARLFDDEH